MPEAPDAITSNAGWDTIRHADHLRWLVETFKQDGIRVSIFVDADERMVEGAAAIGADRIELYTEPYAAHYFADREAAVAPFVRAAQHATKLSLGLNAGHDLSADNLRFFAQQVPDLLEVSIGHALVCDALYLGLENTIQLYRRELKLAH